MHASFSMSGHISQRGVAPAIITTWLSRQERYNYRRKERLSDKRPQLTQVHKMNPNLGFCGVESRKWLAK